MALDGDIFSPENRDFVDNPYPGYKLLRKHDPVHLSSSGFWVLSRYEHVAAGLKDPKLSNMPSRFALVHKRNSDRYLAASVANSMVAFKDNAEHDRHRRTLTVTFQEYMRRSDSRLRDIADQLVAALSQTGRVEFVTEFSIPYATRTICHVMGFPEKDAPLLKRWSGMFFYLFHSIPNMQILDQVNRSLAEFRQYVEDAIDARRRAPGDDLLSLLLHNGSVKFGLSKQEVAANAMLLISDGIENVQAGLSSAVFSLLSNPDQLKLLIENPTIIRSTVNECLRFESPGQYQGRIALETIEIEGKRIHAGSVVLLVLASANRDPSVFDDADRLLIDRSGPRHLAFGSGPHACIGGNLVTLEFETALLSLFDGSRHVALRGSVPEWTARAGHRWPASLHLDVS